MRVAKMREWLRQFPDDMHVCLDIPDKQAGMSCVISVCEGSEPIILLDPHTDTKEKVIVLKPCGCSGEQELPAMPAAINPN
jgi:hypothetical protein